MALLKNIFGASSKSSVDRTNKWEDERQSIYDQIINREKFSYDMNADALYKQYAQQYEQNAKLAMQDTVGQVSALTGGYGNSYAQTAGQAVYNQQMSGLNDKALQLYQMALNQYNAEGDRLMQMYGITADQYQTEYNRIRDEIADEQWQKSYDEQRRQYNLGLAMDAAGMAMDMGQFMLGTAVDVGKFGAGMAFDISRAKAEDAFRREEIDWEKYVYNNNMEYNKERDAVTDSQWQASHALDEKATNANIALNYLNYYLDEKEVNSNIELNNKRLALDEKEVNSAIALNNKKYALDEKATNADIALRQQELKMSDEHFKQGLVYDYAALNTKTGGKITPTGDDAKPKDDTIREANPTEKMLAAAKTTAYKYKIATGIMSEEQAMKELGSMVYNNQMSEAEANQILKNLGYENK